MSEAFLGFAITIGLVVALIMALWNVDEANQKYEDNTSSCADSGGVYVYNDGYPYCMDSSRRVIARY